jgi:hypothetical protein
MFRAFLITTIVLLTTTTLNATLIVVVPTKHGFLVCADKRVHQQGSQGNYEDNFSKIRPIGDRGFFTTSNTLYFEGAKQVLNLSTFKPEIVNARLIDVNELIESFINDHKNDFQIGTIIKSTWEQLKQTMNSELSKLHGRSFPMASGPGLIVSPSTLGTLMSDPRLLYHTDFFYLNAQKQISHNEITCVFDESTKSFSFRTACIVGQEQAPYQLQNVSFVFTQQDVFNEIKSSSNPTFKTLRLDKRIAPFLLDDIHPATMTIPRAQTFARLIIRLTSEHGPSLNPEIRVSPFADCAVLKTLRTLLV